MIFIKIYVVNTTTVQGHCLQDCMLLLWLVFCRFKAYRNNRKLFFLNCIDWHSEGDILLSGTAININPYHNIYLYFAGILRYQVDFQILDPHLDDLFEDFDLDDY